MEGLPEVASDYKGYANPPITEAIVEFKLVGPLDDSVVERVGRRFKLYYENERVVQNFQLELGDDPSGAFSAAATRPPIKSYRRATNDEREVIIASREALLVSQLAPYPGWPEFSSRIKRDWLVWRKEVGPRSLSRIGMRYINRIDIPSGDAPIVEAGDYVHVSVQRPPEFGPTSGYSAQAIFALLNHTNLTITSALVPSPVPYHMSILLDIDLGCTGNLPIRDEDTFAALEVLRNQRNSAFELCITEKTRQLFI